MCHQTQKPLGKSILTDHQSLDRNSDAIFAGPLHPPIPVPVLAGNNLE